jgi:hypothetical protein
VQNSNAGDSLEIDSDWDHIPIVQWARYEVRLNSPLVPTYPQANIRGIVVFFLIEFQPSLELNFLACDDDLLGKAYEL